MSIWVEQVNTARLILTDLLIKEKVKVFAVGLEISENEFLSLNR